MSSSNEVKDLIDAIEALKTIAPQEFLSEVSKSVGSLSSSLSALSEGFNKLNQPLKETSALMETSELKETSMFSKLTDGVSKLSTSLSCVSSIIPMVCIGLETMVTIGSFLNEVFRDKSMDAYYESCQKVVESAASFQDGIESAGSMFEGFNMGMLYASDEAQQLDNKIAALQGSMYELAAAGENMTKRQSKSWDDQLADLEKYQKEELEITQKGQETVQVRAQMAAQMGELSEEEMQMIINDAQTQKDAVIAKLTEQCEEEKLLIAKKYMDQNGVISEKGMEKIRALEEQKNLEIETAKGTYDETLRILSDKYAQQTGLDTALAEAQQQCRSDMIIAETEYNQEIDAIKKDKTLSSVEIWQKEYQAEQEYKKKKERIHEEAYGDLLKSKNKEIGVMMSLSSDMSLCGDEINEITAEDVDKMVNTWNCMPKATEDVMKDALEPMVEEMEKKREILKQKAQKISSSILSQLKKSFDIHSPSRKTRAIFRNLMEGCEYGIEDEAPSLYRKTDHVADEVLSRMSKQAKGMNAAMKAAIQAEVSYKGMGAAVSESRLKTLNHLSASQGIIHTTIDIDGREFAIATSGYIAEEMAFAR